MPLSGPSFGKPSRPRDFSGPQIAVMFFVLALIASIPIITHPLPPIEDYINHLSRMHVIASMGRDADLTRFYEIDWAIVPNLVMDVLVPPLARVMSVYHAGQIFTVATFLLIISGSLALNRVLFGHWSVLPLIGFPLLYNYVFVVGVMNYQFGIGVALWGLACWILLRERAWPLRIAASTVVVLILFFCHLYDVGIYGIGLLAFELRRLVTRGDLSWRRRAVDFVATGLPFLPAVALLLMSPTWTHAGEFSWQSRGKLSGLVDFVELYSAVVAFALAAALIGAAVWAVRHRVLRFHPLGWFLLGVGCVVYLALPRILFATYMGDQRLPIAVAFMVIGCIQLDLRYRIVRRGFIALLLLVLAIRVIEVDVAWTELSQQTLTMRDSLRRITRGSRVLVAYADPNGGDRIQDLGLVHAACLAIIERSSLVTTAFTVVGKQIMHVRPPYRDHVDTEDGQPPTVEELLVAALRPDYEEIGYWEDWTENFDYVYVLFTEEDAENPAPDLLTLAYNGGRFQLYRIIKPPPKPASSAPETPDAEDGDGE